MIIISEPVHFADTHLQVNSAFVALMQTVFESEEILLFAEEKQAKAIQMLLPNTAKEVIVDTYTAYSKEGRFYWFQKIWGEWNQIIKTLKKTKKEQPKLLVWLCVFPTGHLLLILLHRIFFRKQKQLVILHAELEYLSKKRLNIFESFLKNCLRLSFFMAHDNVSYLALGKHIPKVSAIPSNRFFTLVHPFIFTENTTTQQEIKPLKVCIFGTLKKSKNAHLIYELAQSFSKEIGEKRIVFNSVGKIFEDVIPFKNEYVHDWASHQFTPYQQYVQLLQEQNLALFFYDESMYQHSASGALLEAINIGLPIISLKNNCFDSLNEKQLIGESVGNIEEMALAIRRVLGNPISYFQQYQKSKIIFLQQNSFPLQVENLEEIIKKIGLNR